MDLRFCVPPLVNMLCSLFLRPSGSNSEANFSAFDRKFSLLELLYLLLASLFLLLFLFISVDLPLTLHFNRIRHRPRNFSIAVTVLLGASLLLLPNHFWPLYLFVLVSYPFHALFLHQFNHLCHWFNGFLPLLSSYFITFTPDEEPPPLEIDVELGQISISGNGESSSSGTPLLVYTETGRIQAEYDIDGSNMH